MHEPERRRVTKAAPPRRPAPRRRSRSHPKSLDRTPVAETGGGSSGRGPVDDGGDGRRRRDDGDHEERSLLIALGLLIIGAGVLAARLLTRPVSRRR